MPQCGRPHCNGDQEGSAEGSIHVRELHSPKTGDERGRGFLTGRRRQCRNVVVVRVQRHGILSRMWLHSEKAMQRSRGNCPRPHTVPSISSPVPASCSPPYSQCSLKLNNSL